MRRRQGAIGQRRKCKPGRISGMFRHRRCLTAVFALLVALIAGVPQAERLRLACHMTGRTTDLPAAFSAAANIDGCCDEQADFQGGKTTLHRSSCCDLLPGKEGTARTPPRPAAGDMTVVPAFLPAPLVLPAPQAIALLRQSLSFAAASLRAPPPKPCSPTRGPPSFS